MMKRALPLILSGLLASTVLPAPRAQAASPRVLKFSGVPMSQATAIRKEFPFVFEREVSLAEVDEIVRWLMATGQFSGIEVIERDAAEGNGRELVLVASLLRRIQDISIEGASSFSNDEIKRILKISPGQPFERKELLNAVNDDLTRAYASLGFQRPKIEVDFDLPSENEVRIKVSIDEGPPTVVNGVTISTPNTDLAKRIEKISRDLKNQPLTEDSETEFLKKASEYLRKNGYLTARISRVNLQTNPDGTQVKLTYAIDNPYKFDFRMEGNTFFSDSYLIKQLESEKLAGATSSPAPDMADRIRRSYQAVGFANVEVTHVEKINNDIFRQLIQFTIKENPRVRIEKIEIAGNVSRPQEYYTQFIKSTSSDLIGKGFYNRRDIEDGGKRLIVELQNQGFLRAKIQSSRAEYSKDKSSVTIVLTIDEGPLTQVRQVRLEGVGAFQKNQLLDLLKIKSGAALSLKDLEDSLQLLKDFYRSEGYLEMKILNENERNRIVTYNDTNTQATIELQIYEGPKVVVKDVAIEGNSFTKDYVIRRELAFKEGDTLTPEKMDESVYRLQRLGLFGGVSVRMLDSGTSVAERTIVVEVSERDPGLFTLGLGVNNERQLTFRGYLGVAYRNISGTGRAISFRVDPQYSTDRRISYVENRIALSYLEPYIFGDRNRGRINIVRDQSFSEFELQTNRTIIQEENAISLLAERDLTRNIKLTYTGYSFSNLRKFDRLSFDTLENQNIAKIGPLVEFDFRDDIFNPTKGFYSSVNLEYSDPRFGSSEDAKQTIHFIKANATFTHYQQLFGKRGFVWANSFRTGYLANVSSNANGGVPSSEAFFLGGRSSIRGFDPSNDERVPNKYDLNVSSLRDFSVRSSSHMYLIKTELRFPLVRNMWGFDIDGALFYDGGAVLISQNSINLQDPYRDAAGFGLRVPTSFGPISLDFGFKLDRRILAVTDAGEIRESPFAFHFSIGAF